VFVFIALGKRRYRSFKLRDVAPAFNYRWGGRYAWNGEKAIDVVAKLLDLFDLAFKTEPLGFGGSDLRIQFLQFIFDQTAATRSSARARLTPG